MDYYPRGQGVESVWIHFFLFLFSFLCKLFVCCRSASHTSTIPTRVSRKHYPASCYLAPTCRPLCLGTSSTIRVTKALSLSLISVSLFHPSHTRLHTATNCNPEQSYMISWVLSKQTIFMNMWLLGIYAYLCIYKYKYIYVCV